MSIMDEDNATPTWYTEEKATCISKGVSCHCIANVHKSLKVSIMHHCGVVSQQLFFAEL